MDENLNTIEKICGTKPLDVEFTIIGNNPNFIFTPQNNYNIKTLYDIDGNIINVSSWLECANYVYGGWSDVVPGTINWEKNIFIAYVFIFSAYLVKKSFLNFFKIR
jgi:hypothetical protein